MTDQPGNESDLDEADRWRRLADLRGYSELHLRPSRNGGWAVTGVTYGEEIDAHLAALNDDEALIEWFDEVLMLEQTQPGPGDTIIEVSPLPFNNAIAPLLKLAKQVEDEDPDQALLLDASDAGGQPMELRVGDLQRLSYEAGKLGIALADTQGANDDAEADDAPAA